MIEVLPYFCFKVHEIFSVIRSTTYQFISINISIKALLDCRTLLSCILDYLYQFSKTFPVNPRLLLRLLEYLNRR